VTAPEPLTDEEAQALADALAHADESEDDD
jgi:hypothetical protein